MLMVARPPLLPEEPVGSLSAYLERGGGQGLRRALEQPPEAVVDVVTRAGLRGRGGAGFPTGVKWRSVVEAAAESGSPTYLVCNGAEGEPGTFKDRALMVADPYQLIEGILIGLHASGAAAAFIGTKAMFTRVRDRLEAALAEIQEAGWARADDVTLVWGPDEYLFGEESALLEVIEHKLPMPRILPPYQQGLFATMASPNPTIVNNVETLSHVTHILARGAEWFREAGTEESPGTMVFTVTGDVSDPGLYELPLGTPARTLIADIAGAEQPKAIYSGTSNTVFTPDLLDLPLDFDSFREAGTGLGSGGFVVYGAHRDMVQVCSVLARFLAVESCGQCPPCKLHSLEIFDRLDALVRGEGTEADIREIRKRCALVTEANRCYLPVGMQLLVASTLDAFAGEFAAHVGRAGDPDVAVPVPKISELDADMGTVRFDETYLRKRADWSYVEFDERPGQA
jgi:NADH-quinone oxidoreductase subunit F